MPPSWPELVQSTRMQSTTVCSTTVCSTRRRVCSSEENPQLSIATYPPNTRQPFSAHVPMTLPCRSLHAPQPACLLWWLLVMSGLPSGVHTLTWKSTPPVTTYLWPGPGAMHVTSPLCAAKPLVCCESAVYNVWASVGPADGHCLFTPTAAITNRTQERVGSAP